MAQHVSRTQKGYTPVRARGEELVRPAAPTRREFQPREAHRRLQVKERRWAPLAYSVFAAAILLIFAVTYTTYAFSRYRGEILPGVRVDQVQLGGLSEKQATKVITNQLATMYYAPVRLVYRAEGPWDPRPDEIGLRYRIKTTVQRALLVGRRGTFLSQLLDRLPIHPDHAVPLLYTLNDKQLQAYIRSHIVRNMDRPITNANLSVSADGHVALAPRSQPGIQVDVPGTEGVVRSALGALHRETKVLPVNHVPPLITDADAMRVADRIQVFLSYPPVIRIGHRVIVTSRYVFAPFLTFPKASTVRPRHPAIVMDVDPDKVAAYVAKLAAEVDRPPQSPRMRFAGGTALVITPQRNGRTLNQQDAVQQLLGVIKALKPNAKLVFTVTVTKPPIDQSNPATLGIDTLLGAGETSFKGAVPGRLSDIRSVTQRLNDTLISPGQDISYNQLVGSDWPDGMYLDQEAKSGNELVPGANGAMQQVATTFLRALYSSGLSLLERHNHVYRLAWYEPPVGLDAIVSPARNWDLRFHNNTGRYLLIETRLEPVRQELYIYVYGPRLGWKVAVDKLGKVTKVVPHGPEIIKQDPSLPAGDVKQTAWAHDGADVVVQRTITFPNGNVRVDQLTSSYQPSRAIVTLGGSSTVLTPSPKGTPGPHALPTPSAGPGPSPTPTFNH